MHERMKKLRKALDLTQREFGKRIGVKPNTIATYEIGRNEPIDAVISLICREFNVSETWLRTGEGEMFVKRTDEDELAAAVERLVTGESAEFKRRLINALSTLKDEHWILLEQKLNEITAARTEPAVSVMAPATPQKGASFDLSSSIDTDESKWEQEADKFAEKAAALARRQFLDEKRRAKRASSANESGSA